jgi:hypothetical protein
LQLTGLKLLESCGLEGFHWPWQEPVDCSAVHKAREYSDAAAEILPDWRHAKYQVQVLFTLLNEITVFLVISAVWHNVAHIFYYFSLFFRRV